LPAAIGALLANELKLAAARRVPTLIEIDEQKWFDNVSGGQHERENPSRQGTGQATHALSSWHTCRYFACGAIFAALESVRTQRPASTQPAHRSDTNVTTHGDSNE
jgi:hypothetical protein